MSTELKALHDRLLAERPDGTPHDEAQCPLCAMEAIEAARAAGDHPGGGSMSTFTQEQVDAAVAAAVAQAKGPLETRLAELEAAAAVDEVGKAVEEATAPLNEQIAELQRKLDEETVAKAAAEEAKAAVEAWWETAIAEKVEADAVAARKDDRLAQLKDAAPEAAHAYLEENVDRFAAMSDDEFVARIEEYRTISGKEAGSSTTTIPTTTSLQASREAAAAGAGTNPGSMLSELPSLRRPLTDPRTL